MTEVEPNSVIILLVIPQNRFCDQQLLDLKSTFDEVSLKTIILSKSGNEAVGEEKTRVLPDGILVDWDKIFLPKKNTMQQWLWEGRVLKIQFGMTRFYRRF